ncbi:MAG: ostA-like family protein [Alphaproteobacteria bacterium]|nr:ostA-like family protein [Alphaproteobacteria bacterium]
MKPINFPLCLLALLFIAPAQAAPVEITADGALEWKQEQKQYIASGNAMAKQGDTTIKAETLTADYTANDAGKTDITKVTAIGGVTITSGETVITGNKAVYDLKKGYAEITGDKLALTGKDLNVTATERFEYWDKERKIVAVGNAVVIKGKDQMQSARIEAWLGKNAQTGQDEIVRVEAKGNVKLVSDGNIATGNAGTYDGKTGKANLQGNVEVKQGENVITGDQADVDLNNKTSAIKTTSPGQGRVKGIFVPEKQN